MQKLLTLLLAALALVATLPHAGAVTCYVCQGYNAEFPEDKVMNNKYCPDDLFIENKDKILTRPGSCCMAVVKQLNGLTLTARANVEDQVSVSMKEHRKLNQFMGFKGYSCNTDHCNEEPIDNKVPQTHAVS